MHTQDLKEYAPYVSKATAIVMVAVSGDMSALERIPRPEFREKRYGLALNRATKRSTR